MVSICICNLSLYNSGQLLCDWLVLPATKDKLQRLLHRIGINETYEEWFIADHSSDLECVNEVIGEYTSVSSLNRLAERLEELTRNELEMLEAVAEGWGVSNVDELLKLSYNLDCFTLYEDVHDEKELGECFFYELGAIEVPENLLPYFDFEAYGLDLRLSLDGMFTSHGYVEQIDELKEMEY